MAYKTLKYTVAEGDPGKRWNQPMPWDPMRDYRGMKANTQMIATLFDGITRHSPEGVWFKEYAQTHGFHEAVKWRDSGKPISAATKKPYRRRP